MLPIVSVIDDKWIEKHKPCPEAVEWWDRKITDPVKILKLLIKAKKYDWANWYCVRIMSYHDYVSYAVYAAEQVIGIYEKKYPDGKLPRQAIEAAKRCIDNPSEENKKVAKAVDAACAAAYAAGDKFHLKILKYGLKLLES